MIGTNHISEVAELSKKYKIPVEDIVFISLNASSMRSDMPYKRVRFKLKINSKPEETFYFGVPVISDTPFYLCYEKRVLNLNDQEIGKITEAENDTCDATYFRRNDTSLTLNSNSRSSCVGCTFCTTHRQDATDKFKLDSEEKLDKFLTELFFTSEKYGSTRPHFHKSTLPSKEDVFSNLYQVAVVTGCFDSERRAIEHLKMVYRYFRKHGFNGEFKYIGSEIVSKEGLGEIANEIPRFNLCLSLECFTRRKQFLKNIKAKLTLDKAKDVLKTAQERGILTNFTYIVGLDPLSELRKNLKEFVPLVNKLPIFQVFQPHFEEQKQLRAEGADNVEYYLRARKDIEEMFKDTNLRPNSWENYRGLWYFSFCDEPFNDIRV